MYGQFPVRRLLPEVILIDLPSANETTCLLLINIDMEYDAEVEAIELDFACVVVLTAEEVVMVWEVVLDVD